MNAGLLINQINMQMYGSINKSPIKLSVAENKLTRWFVYEWGKTYKAKTSPSDFQVITLEIPLLWQQAITSKGILIPYTNLQLNPYPNTQLYLFCSDNFPFDAQLPSTWLTNCTDPSMRLQSPTREGY